MIQTKYFSAFGREYRTTQFPAVAAMSLMNHKAAPPDWVLSRTEILFKGTWVPLDSRDAINDYVTDVTESFAPRLVLIGIMEVVSNYSFQFVRGWKSTKVPRRFVDGAESVESKHMAPLIGALITDNLATMRELEEYYSLEDAFRMFDALIVKGINQALSHEAAMADAKSRRR